MLRRRKAPPATPFDQKGAVPAPTLHPSSKGRWTLSRVFPGDEEPDDWPQTAEQIRTKMFRAAPRGYEPDQVHTCLDRVAQSLGVLEARLANPTGNWEQPAITSDILRATVFAVVRRGFDMRTTDKYLDGLLDQLHELERLASG